MDGQTADTPLFPTSTPSPRGDSATDTESDEEDENAARVSDIAAVKAGMMEEVKLVLVVNDSLKMSKGKIAAQAGHATLACAMMVKDINPRVSGSVEVRLRVVMMREAERCH